MLTKVEIQELRKTLREKTKENEQLHSGTDTSTTCTVYSNIFMYMYFHSYLHCISNMRIWFLFQVSERRFLCNLIFSGLVHFNFEK